MKIGGLEPIPKSVKVNFIENCPLLELKKH